MKIDEQIDDFIHQEKQIQPNSFLATRIMAKLEDSEQVHRKIPALQKLALAVSLALIVMMGIGIGSIGKLTDNYASININDTQIENLNLYIFDSYE